MRQNTRVSSFTLSSFRVGGGGGGALFSTEWRCPAMARSAAAERLGARLPTPRLTHLGAGGLVRAEIAFFSSTQDTEPTALPRDVTNSV